MEKNIVRNRLTKNITSLSLDKDELRRFLNILQERANAICEIECKKIESFSDVNLEKAKENLKTCAPLNITITGKQSEELFGTIDEVFNSVSFPERIKSLYVNSNLSYKTLFNYYTENSFEIIIDFSKPKVFDFTFQPNEKTPNDSVFRVEGSDNTLVNGVFHEIDSYVNGKPAIFSKIHNGSIYSLLIWFLGIPFGFWACLKLSFFANTFIENDIFLRNAFFVYVFFVSLFVLRILFHYFRWVYPMIEYRSKKERSIIHQAALFSIIIGLIGKFIYDVFSHIF
jgi:hypothetical protein